MPDGGVKVDPRTLRVHLLDAELDIVELNRQIAERERFSIPTIGLEDALEEAIAARNVLRARLTSADEESSHG